MAEGDNNNGQGQGNGTNPPVQQTQQTPPPAKTERVVKKGDTVHLVHFGPKGGKRFDKAHAEAEVTKVHPKAKAVDLIVHADDPKESLVITGAPCDPTGQQPDSWHFPENE